MHRYLVLLWVTMAFFGCGTEGETNKKSRRFTFALPTAVLMPALGKASPPGAMQVFALGQWAFVVVEGPADEDHQAIMLALQREIPRLGTLLKESIPLERIYKLDQQQIYAASQGQLVEKHPGTKRFVMTLEIVNDPKLKAEYKRVHAKGMAWAEITANMKEVGIKDMEIYMDGYRAYLVMDTRPDFDMAMDGERWSKMPREAEWQAFVAKFQKVDPESKATEKWETMSRHP